MTPICYAKMAKEDVPAVAQLERQCFGGRAWSEPLLLQELADANKCYFVAHSGDKVVGYGGFAQVLDEAHIMNIAVDEGARRQGIGRNLLGRILQESAAMGCSAVTLEVSAENLPARRLYESVGFQCAGIRPNYYGKGEDAAIYWLVRQ